VRRWPAPTLTNVQGLSKPTSDSSIFFEVWLPQQDRWNTRFLSAGEGGFAGNPAYARNGLDGSMDDLLRRGYATASTDTGHTGDDLMFAVGHPERIVDWAYRAMHVMTDVSVSIGAVMKPAEAREFIGHAPSCRAGDPAGRRAVPAVAGALSR